MDKWVIISSDGPDDIDYTLVFGLYDTEAEANNALPDDVYDVSYRVVRLGSDADLKEYAEELVSRSE